MNIYTDEQTDRFIGEMPAKMSASRVFRWMMRLISTNDKEWTVLIKENKEIKEVQAYMRPRIRKALGMKNIED